MWKLPDVKINFPMVACIKKRRRLNSASNPQLSQTFHTKDSETDSLFSELRSQRGNYFEVNRQSLPPCFPLQMSTATSLDLNTAFLSTALSSEDVDRRDSKTPIDSREDWEDKSFSPVQEFVCVDKYEAPYLEESVCRISSFCLQNEDMNSSPDGNGEVYASQGNYRLHRNSPLLGYSDCMEDSATLPPIYELEGEESEVTELTNSQGSCQFWSTECLDGTAKKKKTDILHTHNQACSDSCAQYCSNNDSIMTYYSVVPPEEGRESVRNVDDLVDRLDVKHAQGCSSPASPFPLTPPNTCDSSPKLSNIKTPTRNNLHALSGVEVKYWSVLGCCCLKLVTSLQKN